MYLGFIFRIHFTSLDHEIHAGLAKETGEGISIWKEQHIQVTTYTNYDNATVVNL